MKSRFDWRSAYFNLVSLVGMIVMIIAAITGGHGLLKLALPRLSLNQYDWERMESFEAFKRNYPFGISHGRPVKPVPGDSAAESEVGEPSDEELRTEWEEQRRLLIEGQKRNGLWSLMESLMSLVIVLPVFWWHRRKAKQLRVNGLTEFEPGG